ncbi:IS3 family transposase [Brevibacillus sp. LEMMJ03]|uniref:IS3 family transposase n=1 Tax=Brevibacillus sp. LEMMJ03 TaxID=2595056 RepID=UPI00117C9AD1|nr:IS3 family transposase [Brevibacillus sp. LEMMJ03]
MIYKTIEEVNQAIDKYITFYNIKRLEATWRPLPGRIRESDRRMKILRHFNIVYLTGVKSRAKAIS